MVEEKDLPPMFREESCRRFAELQCQDFDLLYISRMIEREGNSLSSVGACLFIGTEVISKIEESYPKLNNKIHNVLSEWQWKNTGNATWARLIKSLELLNDQNLMEHIRKYLSQKEYPGKGSPTANFDIPSSAELSPLSLGSLSALVSGKSSASEASAGALDVRRKTKLLEERFADLLVAASDELETLETRVDQVCLYLTSLKASTQADEPLFDQNTISLLNESSLNQIFTILSCTGAVNFLNFRLLQLVVKKFGKQNLKDQMKKYGEDVTKFMRETKFTDFYRIWSGQSAHGSVPNYQLLVVKLNRKWPEATLSIIADMESYLAGEFQLNAFIFHFSQANPGCVSLVWLIPACAAQLIKEAMKTKQPDFHKMNIQELIVNGEILFSKGEIETDDEDPKPKPLPARKVRTWNPGEKVDLAIGESGIEAEEPMTVGQLFKNVVARFPMHSALKYEEDEIWKTITYTGYYNLCIKAAKSFLKLGLEPKHGVCIIGFNSPEWVISNLGAIFAGGLPAGIYETYNSNACHFVAHNCKANIIVVENQTQLYKIFEIQDRLPHLKAIVQYKGKLSQKYPNVYEWEDFLEKGSEMETNVMENKIESQKPDECALLVYTPGTTGDPKGVMLSHDNVTFNARALNRTYGQLRDGKDHAVSYIPLSHIAAQMTDIYLPLLVGGTVFFAQSDALNGSLGETLRDVKPTFFFGVPRVYETMMERLREHDTSTGLKRLIFTWAKNKGLKGNINRQENRSLPLGWTVAEWILKQILEEVGLQHCEIFAVGTATMRREVHEYFMSINVPLMELYGMSESSGSHTLNLIQPDGWKFGSCGKTIMGVQMKIADPDENGEGEICLRGRNVFMGYLNDEEETKKAIDDDGWLHSGDIGKVQDDFLYITGRIKELIITSSGENIHPMPIESRIKNEIPFLSNVMVVGDQRQFLTCLMTLKCEMDPDTGELVDNLTPHAQQLIQTLGSHNTKVSEIVSQKDRTVFDAIQEGLDRANEHATSETQWVQKWKLLNSDFLIPGGELGPTLKIQRHVVHKKYAETIEDMYSESHTQQQSNDRTVFDAILEGLDRANEHATSETQWVQKWSSLDSDFSTLQEELGRPLSRAVINAKHLGVRFIDPIEIITCDTRGYEYYNTRHDVEIRIPEGAIAPSEGKINVEIGVAMYGPFKLSDEVSRRVSPVVWLCIQNDGFSGFQKDVEITIPHFLQFSTENANQHLTFLKAEHVLEDHENEYQLKPANCKAKFDGAMHGTLMTKHFCCTCITTSAPLPDEHTRYYLGGGISMKGQDWQIIFYVCYFLKSCVRTAEKLLDKDSEEIYLKDFMFSEGKELKIKFQNEVSGWLLNVERFNKISSKDVDFQSMIKEYGLNHLELKEERKLYPPNFEITVRRSHTAEDSYVDFIFQGATEEIVKRISLNTAKASRSQIPPPYVVNQKIDLECVDGTTVLDEDDLRDVRSAVADLAGEWMNLGISLGMRKSDLDPILSANSKSPSDCLRDMLTVWLRKGYNVERFGRPTWRRVVEAVEDKVGGKNPALAENIAGKHPVPGSQ